MVQDKSFGSRMFEYGNIFLLTLLGLACLLPFVHVVAVSLSSSAPASANAVTFWPKGLTWENYAAATSNARLWNAFFWSILRVLVGTVFTLSISILTAYPMSRDSNVFRARTVFVVLFLFAMLFDSGIIARFTVIRMIGLYDTFWVLVVPAAFSPWIIVLLMNFFRSLPKEMEEAAVIDGANHFDILFKIYIPLSTAALATTSLFTMVGLWNDWFTAMLYLRSPDMYPLQTYLQNFLNITNIRELFSMGDVETFIRLVSNRGLRTATLTLSLIPIMLVYPLLQRYFVKGIVLGAVKG